MRQKSRLSTYGFVILTSFVGGYLCANFFSYAEINRWLNTPIISKKPANAKTSHATAPLPKPKLEFYTLLANTRAPTTTPTNNPPTVVAMAAPISTPTTTPAPAPQRPQEILAKQVAVQVATPINVSPPPSGPIPAAKGLFWVQVAAFKRQEDADHMKGTLVLKGFDVTVNRMMVGQANWYRVMVGPFASQQAAQKAQVAMAEKEHITGMIRKMA